MSAPSLRPRLRASTCRLAVWLLSAIGAVPASAQLTPYDPYAESQAAHPPVRADGTLHWGTFYKSASVQKAYERLWNLGACRGTNKAITVPVERNRLIIDNLPEASFTGTVRESAGSLTGGVIAFSETAGPDAPVVFAQLHPAGVTRLQIGGRTTTAALRPGITVRFRGMVDPRGRVADSPPTVDIVTPSATFTPDPLRAGVMETIVGTIQRSHKGMLTLKVDAGKIRRVTVHVAAESPVMIVDAAQLDLIAPGDKLEVTGRRWSGEGAMGAGTVFASEVVVHKAALTGQEDQPAKVASAP